MSENEIPNANMSEFTELKMESEYNFLDLSQKIKRKNSTQLNEKSNLLFPTEKSSSDD